MRALWISAVAMTALACSSAPPAEPVPPPAATPDAPTAPAPGGSPDATSGVGSDAGAAAEPEGPSACASGMVLVEGEYCTEVEHTCEEEWYAKANKKRVCEKFKHEAKCVGERVKKRYCIDKYSWPNVKGERPEVMNRFHQAQVKCAAMGKRMCTETEWSFACEGPEMLPFPYGYERDPNKCNGDHSWDHPKMSLVAKRDPTELARLWKGVPSGSQPECVSPFGVADLPANNDEVTSSEHFGGGWRGKYDSVNTGGPWYKGVRNQCRPKIYTHAEDFYYYFLGFRCCAEPDAQETDPLTPKQIKKGRKMQWVEKRAHFSVDEMKEKLRLKEQGKCSCEASDILCKTMCGTLLGPGAKDADLKAPR